MKQQILDLEVYSLKHQEKEYANQIQCIYENPIGFTLIKYYDRFDTPAKALVIQDKAQGIKSIEQVFITFILDSAEEASKHDDILIGTFIAENGDGIIMDYYGGLVPPNTLEISITKFDALLYDVQD